MSPGRAEIGTQVRVRFSSRRAEELLLYEFAQAITALWKGLMLKGCEDPYLTFNGTNQHIKLKTTIPGWETLSFHFFDL